MKINSQKILIGGSALLVAQSLWTQNKTEQPNVLIIMTDEQAWDAVGYAGNALIKTPNLDRLASQGVNFSQAITACPVSVPARTSILTGRLTEATSIRDNGDLNRNDCYYPTFDEILAKRAYKVECYGKFHSPAHMANVYMNPPEWGKSGSDLIINSNEDGYLSYLKQHITKRSLKKGELYETTFYGGLVPYKLDPIDRRFDYLPSGEIPTEELNQRKLGQGDVHGVLDLPAEHTITALQAKSTIKALERLKNDKFIVTCSFHCPHVPITPSEPFASMYKPDKMTVSPSIKDNRENSPYQPNSWDKNYTDPEKVKYMVANYYAFVTEIDEWVGKILSKLDELKLTDNTLVIFVSDHGEMLGAHGMRGKFCFYEESVRVPFLIRYPGKIKSGQKIETPVSTLNIFSTILDYAGLKSIPSDGYSLKPVMEGAPAKYDFAISEWTWTNQKVPSIMIRTEDWKLMTTHRDGGKNVEALYNLKNDPYEMNNLLGSNSNRFNYNAVCEELKSKLLGYLTDVNSPLKAGIEKRELIRK